MNRTHLVFFLFFTSIITAQTYSGAGDIKFQVGANFQDNATGIGASLDFGVGENISLGVFSSYILGVDKFPESGFEDRFDLQGRFNAHLGNVINVDPNFDVYPGLYVGLRNFGTHIGARYFFSPGFGVFTELKVPLSKYETGDLTPIEKFNNQVTVFLGASFNI